MNEVLSEIVAVRLSPTTKSRLEDVARRSVSKDMTAHIRYAVNAYIEGGVTLDHATALDDVAGELNQVSAAPLVTRNDVLAALINHWHSTKRDCYGSRFAG